MEVDIRMTLEPAIIFGLVSAEVVEHDMDRGVSVPIACDDLIHEIEEFDPSAAIFVSDFDLACGHLEGRKQGRSTVALVVMAMAAQSPAMGSFRYP